MLYTTPMSAQFAIRNEGKNVVHVQVTGPKSAFVGEFQRSYGGAWNIRNAALFQAIQERQPELHSKAGTSRMYVPGTLANNGDLEITVAGKAIKTGSKVFGGDTKSVAALVKLTISDDEVFPG